jgi:peptide-methionine (S)-S-oxide reductase
MISSHKFLAGVAGLAVTVAIATAVATAGAQEPARLVPAPATDEPATGTSETAVLSGGCFWGVQGVFEHVKGVQQVLAGYAGGQKDTADYETVSSGTTGHAESVQIRFDPAKISYGHLLQIFFSVALDPTEINRQGPDSGTQYRSEIFYGNDQQKQVAEAYVAQLNGAHVYAAPIATRIDPMSGFYPAEAYHQDFLANHPSYPYIVVNDAPKVANLQRLFPADYQATPTLSTTPKQSS